MGEWDESARIILALFLLYDEKRYGYLA